ncbi:MAG: ribosome-associated translation inhibitor RaiA [Planctomycetaceae bacterium]|nr:ribosome-associated translation inhibitor RaiA [Planctomycetaceae bacterium]
MQINISTRHGQLSAATQERITEKVEKLSRYFDRLTAILVTVDLDRREAPVVEIQVSVERSEALMAAEQSAEVLSALDGALHKIEQQIRRHKDKRTERRRPPIKHLEVPAENEPEAE